MHSLLLLYFLLLYNIGVGYVWPRHVAVCLSPSVHMSDYQSICLCVFSLFCVSLSISSDR